MVDHNNLRVSTDDSTNTEIPKPQNQLELGDRSIQGWKQASSNSDEHWAQSAVLARKQMKAWQEGTYDKKTYGRPLSKLRRAMARAEKFDATDLHGKRTEDTEGAASPTKTEKSEIDNQTRQEFNLIFGGGFKLLQTDGEGLLCGLQAILFSLQEQAPAYPLLRFLTIEELFDIATSKDVSARVQDASEATGDQFFTVGHLAAVLEEFGARQGIPLRLGVAVGDTGSWIDYKEGKVAKTIWIHKDGGETESSYGHYSGLQGVEWETVSGAMED